jgi:hypothetical protein
MVDLRGEQQRGETFDSGEITYQTLTRFASHYPMICQATIEMSAFSPQ